MNVYDSRNVARSFTLRRLLLYCCAFQHAPVGSA
eukprot:COSAG06_NODE_48886_length_329_cov_0.660870_1_plen_33_part_10